MALQRINWTQIDSANVPSGSEIDLGSISGALHAVYADNLYISGQTISDFVSAGADVSALNLYTASLNDAIQLTGSNLTVKGNLTVLGSTTSVNSTTVSIGDNIIELNGTNAGYGGLLVKDPTNPNKISGSLLWDTANDRWVAGPQGSEENIVLESELTSFSSSLNDILGDVGIWRQTGSFYATSNDLELTGSLIIRGNLRVEGATTLVQTVENQDTLTVSGAMSIVKNMVNSQIMSASLSIQGLGRFSDTKQTSVIDCGDGFF